MREVQDTVRVIGQSIELLDSDKQIGRVGTLTTFLIENKFTYFLSFCGCYCVYIPKVRWILT